MVSSLSMNRMPRMPEILEPIGRPSFWQKPLKQKYMLFSVTVKGLLYLVWRGGVLGCDSVGGIGNGFLYGY